MTPMPPITPMPVSAAEPAAEAARVSAFQPGHGASLFADPAAMGRSILASLDGFQAQAAHVRDLSHAMQTHATQPGAAAAPDLPQATSPVEAQGGMGGAAERQHMLGVMLETFDFAMQTEMVTRAATTFTSSVNTLIKAQ